MSQEPKYHGVNHCHHLADENRVMERVRLTKRARIRAELARRDAEYARHAPPVRVEERDGVVIETRGFGFGSRCGTVYG